MTTTPTIRYYARFTNTTAKGAKVPKYSAIYQAGYYPPMEQLVGRDGYVSVYLQEKRETQTKSSTPKMSLQAKGSLNLTGLKDYFVDGKLSGFAYGYPYDRPTYGKGEKPNPLYDYKNDGFLFVIHQDGSNTADLTPTMIEMLVIEGGKTLISSYCKMLAMGGFNEVLDELRRQAQDDDV